MVNFRLDGITAVITGAGSGLGLGFGREMQAAGAAVVCLDRVAPLDAGFEYLACDVADPASVARSAAALADRRSLVLVNNVGIGLGEPSFEPDPDNWSTILRTNVIGTMTCSAAFGHVMRRSGGGAIVNVASILGMEGVDRRLYRRGPAVLPGEGEYAAYAASKGGVIALTRALAHYWAPYNIRVNCVAPGIMDNGHSGVLDDPGIRARLVDRIPLGRIGVGEDLAGAVIFLASSASSFITGAVLPVDGGWTA